MISLRAAMLNKANTNGASITDIEVTEMLRTIECIGRGSEPLVGREVGIAEAILSARI